MTQILLHKQTLTQEQIAKLDAQGVIAIQTQSPKDFGTIYLLKRGEDE